LIGLSRFIGAVLAAEQHLDLSLRGIAETALKRWWHQGCEAIGSQWHTEHHDGDDRCCRCQRPADDGSDAVPAGNILVQPGAARGEFGCLRGIANLEPRQRGRRQAAHAQNPGRTVDPPEFVIRPPDRGLRRLVEFKPILECQGYRATAVRRSIEINGRSGRLIRCRSNFRLVIHGSTRS
jgi:hypothetical protein